MSRGTSEVYHSENIKNVYFCEWMKGEQRE